MIRAVESCSEGQPIVTANSRKRNIGLFVPKPCQLDRRQTIEIAPLVQRMAVAIERVNRSHHDDRHYGNADHKDRQVDNMKAFDRIACRANNQNAEQEKTL